MLSFIHCPTKSSDVVIYGWINNIKETTHQMLFALAVADFGFNDNHEPVGGGIIISSTCEYLPSIHYGDVEERILKAVFHKARCES